MTAGALGRTRRVDPKSSISSVVPAQRPRQVIILDDDPASLLLFAKVLQTINAEDLEVHGFGGPEEALAFTAHERPALALVDQHLGPGQMTGLEFIRRLHAQAPNETSCKTVMISSDTDPELVAQAKGLDVKICVQKAANAYDLLVVCCELLEIPVPSI